MRRRSYSTMRTKLYRPVPFRIKITNPTFYQYKWYWRLHQEMVKKWGKEKVQFS